MRPCFPWVVLALFASVASAQPRRSERGQGVGGAGSAATGRSLWKYETSDVLNARGRRRSSLSLPAAGQQ
jgi:hypothetical protein